MNTNSDLILIPFTSILTLISCTLAIIYYFQKKESRNQAFQMIILMISNDLIFTLTNLSTLVFTFNNQKFQYIFNIIRISIINVTGIASVLWITIISYSILYSVNRRWENIQKKIKEIFIIGNIIVPLTLTFIFLISGGNVNSLQFNSNNLLDISNLKPLQLIFTYPILSFILFPICLTFILKALQQIKQQYDKETFTNFSRIIYYPFSPLIATFLITLKLILQQFNIEYTPFLNTLALTLVCSWGFLNITNFGYLTKITENILCKMETEKQEIYDQENPSTPNNKNQNNEQKIEQDQQQNNNNINNNDQIDIIESFSPTIKSPRKSNQKKQQQQQKSTQLPEHYSSFYEQPLIKENPSIISNRISMNFNKSLIRNIGSLEDKLIEKYEKENSENDDNDDELADKINNIKSINRLSLTDTKSRTSFNESLLVDNDVIDL